MNNPAAHLSAHLFKKGVSGNPKGRPKGRRKLTDAEKLVQSIDALTKEISDGFIMVQRGLQNVADSIDSK